MLHNAFADCAVFAGKLSKTVPFLCKLTICVKSVKNCRSLLAPGHGLWYNHVCRGCRQEDVRMALNLVTKHRIATRTAASMCRYPHPLAMP